jgi:predicted lipoprotein with Yx(FWY)xxD motif
MTAEIHHRRHGPCPLPQEAPRRGGHELGCQHHAASRHRARRGPGHRATVRVANALVSGRTEANLADAKGLPLYFYGADTAARSLSSGRCARLQPVLGILSAG